MSRVDCREPTGDGDEKKKITLVTRKRERERGEKKLDEKNNRATEWNDRWRVLTTVKQSPS